jgi:hypothetical protein
MIEFILPKGVGRKVRLWIDELPENAVMPTQEAHIDEVLNAGAGIPRHARVAIEMFQPIGGMFRYGLLGAEINTSSKGKLLVSVPTETPETDRHYTGSLAGKLDEVVIGGNIQYARAVIDGIRDMGEEKRPEGHLSICCVAHGAVGSAPIVFQMLARGIIRLLLDDGQPRTAEEVAQLLA